MLKAIKNIRKRNKREKGFSLIELLMVIAIIAILAAIAIPQFERHMIKSTNSAAQSDVRNNLVHIVAALF